MRFFRIPVFICFTVYFLIKYKKYLGELFGCADEHIPPVRKLGVAPASALYHILTVCVAVHPLKRVDYVVKNLFF